MCDCNCSCVTILTVSRDYEYNRRLDKQIQQEDPKTAHTTIHGKCTEICIICQNSYLDWKRQNTFFRTCMMAIKRNRVNAPSLLKKRYTIALICSNEKKHKTIFSVVLKARVFCGHILPQFLCRITGELKIIAIASIQMRGGEIQPLHTVWHPRQGLREQSWQTVCVHVCVCVWESWLIGETFGGVHLTLTSFLGQSWSSLFQNRRTDFPL